MIYTLFVRHEYNNLLCVHVLLIQSQQFHVQNNTRIGPPFLWVHVASNETQFLFFFYKKIIFFISFLTKYM